MKTELQRIAIAEACGWQRDKTTDAEFEKSRIRDIWVTPDGKRLIHGISGTPDYLYDLNAIHEAEKTLTQSQRVDYMNALGQICGTQQEKPFATAAQRAEAFLRTLGLWKEAA